MINLSTSLFTLFDQKVDNHWRLIWFLKSWYKFRRSIRLILMLKTFLLFSLRWKFSFRERNFLLFFKRKIKFIFSFPIWRRTTFLFVFKLKLVIVVDLKTVNVDWRIIRRCCWVSGYFERMGHLISLRLISVTLMWAQSTLRNEIHT